MSDIRVPGIDVSNPIWLCSYSLAVPGAGAKREKKKSRRLPRDVTFFEGVYLPDIKYKKILNTLNSYDLVQNKIYEEFMITAKNIEGGFIVHTNSDGVAYVAEHEIAYVKYGKYHNLNGPASIQAPYNRMFWAENNGITKSVSLLPTTMLSSIEHFKYDSKAKMHSDKGFASYNNDRIEFYNHGKLHNESGPAYICLRSGELRYAKNGRAHRKDGPAIINQSKQSWFKNGLLHRAYDLPAVEWKTGPKEWLQNGVHHRANGPAIEWAEKNIKIWVNYGLLHKEDGPAVNCSEKYKEWWVNGKLHNETGPAIIGPGIEEWWIEGKRITTEAKKWLADRGLKDLSNEKDRLMFKIRFHP